jgi:hypothetical protein
VYVRYRWGFLSVGIGATMDDAVDASFSDDEAFGEQVGDGYDGVMNTSDMLTRTGLVLAETEREATQGFRGYMS